MPSRRKRNEPSDWRPTMEQIGRELGKIYRQPKRLPRRLRAVVTQLERKLPVPSWSPMSQLRRSFAIIRRDLPRLVTYDQALPYG